jgi:hypothetical protein
MRFVRGWTVAAVSTVVAVGLSAGAARTEELPPPPPPPGVYLIASITGTFDKFPAPTPNPDDLHQSQTILVRLGSVIGGAQVTDSRVTLTAGTNLPHPDDVPLDQLNGHQVSIVGGVRTTTLDPHMVTPTPGTIPPEIQEAFVQASETGALDALTIEYPIEGPPIPHYPTTYEIGNALAPFLPPDYSQVAVLDALFTTSQTLSVTGSGDSAIIDSEGELFPHEPSPRSLFWLKFKVHANDGVVLSDVFVHVDVDIAPGSSVNPVNIKNKKGFLPVALLSSAGLSAADIDPGTLTIGTVHPAMTHLQDVNGDGVVDLMCQWSVQSLLSDGVLSATTTNLKVFGALYDSTPIRGLDVVKPVTK